LMEDPPLGSQTPIGEAETHAASAANSHDTSGRPIDQSDGNGRPAVHVAQSSVALPLLHSREYFPSPSLTQIPFGIPCATTKAPIRARSKKKNNIQARNPYLGTCARRLAHCLSRHCSYRLLEEDVIRRPFSIVALPAPLRYAVRTRAPSVHQKTAVSSGEHAFLYIMMMR
jgi:hypothetical protein